MPVVINFCVFVLNEMLFYLRFIRERSNSNGTILVIVWKISYTKCLEKSCQLTVFGNRFQEVCISSERHESETTSARNNTITLFTINTKTKN